MLMPILQIHSEDMPAYAIVCGDPARAEKISRNWTEPRSWRSVANIVRL